MLFDCNLGAKTNNTIDESIFQQYRRLFKMGIFFGEKTIFYLILGNGVVKKF